MISRSRLSQAGIPAHDPKVTRRRREPRCVRAWAWEGVGEEPNAVWVRTTLVRAMIALGWIMSATATVIRIISPCGPFGNFDAIIICPRILLQGVPHRGRVFVCNVCSQALPHPPVSPGAPPPSMGKPQTTTHVPRPTRAQCA